MDKETTVQLNVVRRLGFFGRVTVAWQATGDHGGVGDITPLNGQVTFRIVEVTRGGGGGNRERLSIDQYCSLLTIKIQVSINNNQINAFKCGFCVYFSDEYRVGLYYHQTV